MIISHVPRASGFVDTGPQEAATSIIRLSKKLTKGIELLREAYTVFSWLASPMDLWRC